MKSNKDKLGAYEIPIKTKPFDEADANSIYLALYDNGKSAKNSCRFKVVLTMLDQDNKRHQLTAPILNKFQASRWLRSVDKKDREQPFYRQALEMSRDLKKEKMSNQEKDFSCGFFHPPNQHDTPFAGAYAYMVWDRQDESPIVGVRYFDYTIDCVEMILNDNTKGKAPKWNNVIQAPSKGMVNVDW